MTMKKTIILIAVSVLAVVALGLAPRACSEKQEDDDLVLELPEDPNLNLDYIIADGDTLEIDEGTSNYAKVSTVKPFSKEKLIRMGKDLDGKFEPRIVYFHVYGKMERGEEYACYQRGMIFDYREKDTEKAVINLNKTK